MERQCCDNEGTLSLPRIRHHLNVRYFPKIINFTTDSQAKLRAALTGNIPMHSRNTRECLTKRSQIQEC